MMKKAILQLGELTCPSCLTKIEHAVAGTNGVDSVKVLFNAGKVKAEFNADQTSADDLADVVEKLGYKVQNVKVKDL
ncbi:heavy-metal-associated domain-containing protein [Paucilactobacillus sp. N302-9]